MSLPVELWHLVFEYIGLSDAFQLSLVSGHFSGMIAQYKGHLFIDSAESLKNENRNMFMHGWLRNQTRLDLSSVDLAPHEIGRIIDQYPKINTIVIRNIVDECSFFSVLGMYVRMDPSHYEQRSLRIELGRGRGDRKLTRSRIINTKSFNQTRISFYRWFCDACPINLLKSESRECHECSEHLKRLNICINCKLPCCDDCITIRLCNGCVNTDLPDFIRSFMDLSMF